MRALPAGRHFFRGSDGYEAARRGTVWHRRVPDRYPEVIVQAVSADDIVSAIRYATVNGHKVSVVSGGHSFAASHLRDGAVLLDVSRIDHASIDADKGRAVVGPGKGGSVLMAELEAQGLFFPGGHCRGVCLGGYLLQGGYGWNSRIYGPACESVIGLDVITADGAQIHCDADNHADLYWAARGAGPGFFGVVTSFYLKLYPRPATCGTSVYVYPFDLADEVFTWARAVSAEVDPRVELQALASRPTTATIRCRSVRGWALLTPRWMRAGSSIRSDRRRAGPRCGHGFGWADRTSRCARHPRSRPRRCVPSRRS